MGFRLLFLAFFTALFLPAGAQWTPYAPISQQNYHFVRSYDSQFFYGGGSGIFIRTLNGGATWDSLPLLDQSNNPYLISTLYSIDFISPSTGVATGFMLTGNTEIILKTTNGGANWTTVSSNSSVTYPRYLNSIRYVNATTIIAVGRNGRILRSTNGGSSWTTISSGGSNELTDIMFANATLGFIVGQGKILKTTNGGASWPSIQTVPDFLASLWVENDTLAYAGSDNGKIYRTINAGVTWTVLPFTLGGAEISDIEFTSVDTGYAVCGSSLYKTCDGGTYWEVQEFQGVDLRSIHFRTPVNGLLVGDDGRKYYTLNGGGAYYPVSRFTISNVVSCPDSTIYLSSTSDPAYAHQWFLNGNPISTSYATTIAISAPSQLDTVMLVVSNGTYTDTLSATVNTTAALTMNINSSVTNDTLCNLQSTTVKVFNSESGVTYRLRKGTTNIGGAQAGNGGTLTFNTGVQSVTDTTWNIMATKTVAGCGTANFYNYHTIFVSRPNYLLYLAPASDTICKGQSTTLTISSSEPGVSYQVFRGSTSLGILTGNGGPVSFNSGVLSNTTVFTTQATTPAGCMEALAPTTVVVDRVNFFCAVTSALLEPGDTLQIANNTTPAGLSYSWQFGTGATPATSTQADPGNVSYTGLGVKSIKLNVVTPYGCPDSLDLDTKVIATIPPANCSYSRGAQKPTGNGIQTLAADASGNVYYTVGAGSATSHLAFTQQNDSIHTPYAPAANFGNRTFLVKTDEKGIYQWQVAIYHGSMSNPLMGVTCDVNGNVYAAYHHAVSTDTCRIYSTNGSSVKFRPPYSGGNRSFVLMKFNRDGVLQWYQNRVWFQPNAVMRMKCDETNGVYYAINNCIVKYDTSGVFQWSSVGYYTVLAFDGNNNLWSCEQAFSLLLRQIDKTTGVVQQTINTGSVDFFPDGLEFDVQNNFYISGRFNGTCTLPNVPPITGSGDDMLIAKVNASGQAQWVKGTSSQYNASHAGLAVAGNRVLMSLYVQPGDVMQYGSASVTTPAGNWAQVLVILDTLGQNDTMLRVVTNPMNHSCCRHLTLVASHGSNFIFGGSYVTASTFDFPVIPAYPDPTFRNYFVYRTDLSCFTLPQPPDVAAFGIPAQVCEGVPAQLIDQSQPQPASVSWAMPGGNPSSSSLSNPQVIYSSGGTYTVTLTAVFPSGDTLTTFQTILVNTPPVIAVIGPDSLCAGTGASFTATGASTYAWPDGSTGSTYTLAPVNADTIITLTGTSAAGCTASTGHAVTVLPLPAPGISGPGSLCTGNGATFTASGASTYTWPDGSTGTTYTLAPISADTIITLTATSATGCTASTGHTVIALPLPVISVSGPDTLCAGNGASFTASGASTYTWPDGSTGATYTLAPVNADTLLTVTGTSAAGCGASANYPVAVIATPSFTVSGPDTLCAGTAGTFTAGGALFYLWPDGSAAPVYTTAALYTDTLIAVIGYGAASCAADDSFAVAVRALPVVTLSAFSPDTVCATNGLVNLPAASPAGGTYWDAAGAASYPYYDPLLAPLGMNVVHYTWMDSFGCTGGDSTQVFVDICSSVETPVASVTLANLCGNGIIELQPGRVSSIHVLNTLGQQVLVSQDCCVVDLRDRPAGIYFIILSDEQGQPVQQVRYLKY